MKLRLLGDRTPRAFLQCHWQKRPLFVRGALPGFRGAVGPRALATLASRDDVESRIVVRRGRKRQVAHGPFANAMAAGKRNWTLLVSGVNLHVGGADALLRRFDFVPQARLDDVMVSYATPGGGVGPHVDSYDVFLLQGPGTRRWRIWRPDGAFHEEVMAEIGDLLYLPPGWRHDGVALDACLTYSIGFRAPTGKELAARFLDWLHERGLPDAGYADPQLAPASRPAAIPSQLISFSNAVLKRIRWSKGDVARFLGEYLTEPKPHVVFRRNPAKPGGRPVLAGADILLDPKTQLLYSSSVFFITGEPFSPGPARAALLRELADRRRLDGSRAGPIRRLLYDWHGAGYLRFRKNTSGKPG